MSILGYVQKKKKGLCKKIFILDKNELTCRKKKYLSILLRFSFNFFLFSEALAPIGGSFKILVSDEDHLMSTALYKFT